MRWSEKARLAALRTEVAVLEATFPELRNGRAQRATQAVTTSRTRPRKRSAMTAAQRKAVGLRMKKYWAARRKEDAAPSKA
jgi:hypothetical protein